MATALATGVFEELVFRGGLFRLSQEWFGTWAACSSRRWCSVRPMPMPRAPRCRVWCRSPPGPALLLSATYLLTGRLWLGIGLHAAGTTRKGTVYSGIVSGNAPPNGFFKSTFARASEWLTGGSFGVEARSSPCGCGHWSAR